MAAAAFGLGGSLLGGFFAGREASKNRKMQQEQYDWLRNMYGRESDRFGPMSDQAQADLRESRGEARGAFGDVNSRSGDLFRSAGDLAESGQFGEPERAGLAGSADAMGFSPEESENLFYGKDAEGLYLSPEEQEAMKLTGDRANAIRGAATTPYRGATMRAQQQGEMAAARRGGYMPGWNATMREISDEAGRRGSEAALNAEAGIQTYNAGISGDIATQRTNALRDTLQNRAGATRDVRDARRDAATAQQENINAIRDARMESGEAAQRGQQAAGQLQLGGAQGMGDIFRTDTGRFGDIERNRTGMLTGLTGQAGNAANNFANTPGGASTFFNAFRGTGGSGGFTWGGGTPAGITGSPGTMSTNPVGGGLGTPPISGVTPGPLGPSGAGTMTTNALRRNRQPVSARDTRGGSNAYRYAA